MNTLGLTEREDIELDERIEAMRLPYVALKGLLEALPVSRMRSLAMTDLESSFSRAIFAVAGVQSPIDEV